MDWKHIRQDTNCYLFKTSTKKAPFNICSSDILFSNNSRLNIRRNTCEKMIFREWMNLLHYYCLSFYLFKFLYIKIGPFQDLHLVLGRENKSVRIFPYANYITPNGQGYWLYNYKYWCCTIRGASNACSHDERKVSITEEEYKKNINSL